MPKSLHEITKFVTGTITTPSESDIPDDAASFSLNIDPLASEGTLTGIKTDSFVTYKLIGTPSRVGVDATKMTLIHNDHQKDLLYWNGSRLRKRFNIFQPNNTQNTTDLSTSDETVVGLPSMVNNNKESHIGMGNTSASKTLWAGHISHKQFDGSIPDGLQLEDADLKVPVAFRDMHKVIYTNNNIYGIEFEGEYIYEFNLAKKLFKRAIKPISKHKAKITAICKSSDGHIWVLDSHTISATNLGVLYKVEKDSLLSMQETTLIISGNGINAQYTDMEQTANKIWLSSSRNIGAGNGKPYLVNVAIPTSNGTATVVDRLPYLYDNNSTDQGYFNLATGNNQYVGFCIPDVNLVNIYSWSTTSVGLAVEFRDDDNNSQDPIPFYKENNDPINVGACILVVHEDRSNLDILNGNVNESGLIKLEKIALGATTNIFAESVTIDGSASIVKKGTITNEGNYTIIGTSSPSDTNLMKVPPLVAFNNNNNGYTLTIGTDMYTSDDTNTTDSASTIEKDKVALVITPNGSDHNLNIFSNGDSVGRWSEITTLSTGDFDDEVPLVVQQADAKISLSLATTSSTGFTANKNYFYAMSYIYDGYQESPLSTDFIVSQGTSAKAVEVIIELYNIASISKRVSSINIYASEGDQDSSSPLGFFRFVKNVSLKSGWTDVSDDTTAPDWGSHKEYKFLHDGSFAQSYESNTGISEILTDFTPNYKLSTALNSMLFIGDCYHPQIENTSTYIFKSRPYNFDQFNWVSDFLVLPTTPLAIKGFKGRLYAFDENTTYRIEPNSMYIEDTLLGAGCVDQDSICVSNYGMCYANDNNIYLHDGQNSTPIGTQIIKHDVYSWDKRDVSWKPKIAYDSTDKCFLVFWKKLDDGKYYIWSFNMIRKRWDLWEFEDTTEPKSVMTGTDGYVYVSNGTHLKKYRGDSTYRPWSWTSKKLSMEQNSVNKKFHNVKITGTPSGDLNTNVKAYVDSDTAMTTTGTTNHFKIETKGKFLKIELIGQTGSIDAIGTVYRRLRIR